jgi:hypothetical protein
MFARSLIAAAAFLSTAGLGASAEETQTVPDMPSAQEVQIIETHASTWFMLVEREQLRSMTKQWPVLMAKPDSAKAIFTTMFSMASEIVDQLMLSTGISRGILMRWLEKDVGLKAYFFPPYPENNTEKKQSELWKILTPILPIILYRFVDRIVD